MLQNHLNAFVFPLCLLKVNNCSPNLQMCGWWVLSVLWIFHDLQNWVQQEFSQSLRECGWKKYWLHSPGCSYKSPPPLAGKLWEGEMGQGLWTWEREQNMLTSLVHFYEHAKGQRCNRYFPGHLLWTERQCPPTFMLKSYSSRWWY